MREIEPLLHHGIIIAVPPMVGLLLKALGLVHGISLHTWPLDVDQNLGWGGAIGGFFSAAAAAAGWPGFFKGEPPSYFNPPTGPPTPPPNLRIGARQIRKSGSRTWSKTGARTRPHKP